MLKEVKPGLYKLGEGIYLEEDKKGKYHKFYPIKKDLEKPLQKGNIDWKNVLGWRNKGLTIMTLVFMGLLLFSVWAYDHDIETYRDAALNPWKYYPSLCREPLGINYTQLNWTNITIKNEWT